jgi:hypothetical protein
MIILPRQARDKHRESTQKKSGVFSGRSKTYIGDTSYLAGDFLSFPKAGACAEGQALGDGGCVWKRLPRARMMYGADLIAAGFNVSTMVRTTPFLRHLYIKCIILPRQARDKHSKS